MYKHHHLLVMQICLYVCILLTFQACHKENVSPEPNLTGTSSKRGLERIKEREKVNQLEIEKVQCEQPQFVHKMDNDTRRTPTQFTQHALVVGIDQYRHAVQFTDTKRKLVLRNLSGAVNDAKLLRDTFRHAQVNLPDKRVLLNADATRAKFEDAWQDMLDQAQPGDTLILTFSGHGGQLSDIAPLGEEDGYDEFLVFHDFNPDNPTQGSIIDNDMYDMLEEASIDYNIIFLIDACHSSGAVRNIGYKPRTRPRSGKIRYIGQYETEEPLASSKSSTQSEMGEDPRHITLITAVEHDGLVVEETTIDNKWHGALSWYFAQALEGKADGNKNGFLERSELSQFLQVNIRIETNNVQWPKVTPDEEMSVIKLSSHFKSSTQNSKLPDITAFVEDAPIPSGLKHVSFLNLPQAVDLLFEVRENSTDVRNKTGEVITTLKSSNDFSLWQPVIDKERLLKVLKNQFNMRYKPICLTLQEGDGLHQEGEMLHFDIGFTDNNQKNLNALILFNLTGNGKLEFLYPSLSHNHPERIPEFPYTQELEVSKPFGKDNLVVILCEKPANELYNLLGRNIPTFEQIPLPDPKRIQEYLENNTCQVGQYAFFSGE